MITLKNNSKARLLILVSIIGIFSYLPQLFAIATIAKDFSTTDDWWIPFTIGAVASILNLVFRLFLILGILYISSLILGYFKKEIFYKDGFKVIEIVGKALFFNISALRSKLDMAQHNDSVGIIILTVSI